MRPEWTHAIALSPAFHDLDPMGIVWHGHYVKYFELARCALLQRFGYDYEQMRQSGYGWPVVDLRTKYVRPLTYGQPLVVEARITEWENRLRVDYVIRDRDTGLVHTKAHTLQVAVELASGELQLVTPAVFRQRIGAPS